MILSKYIWTQKEKKWAYKTQIGSNKNVPPNNINNGTYKLLMKKKKILTRKLNY